MSIRRPVAGMDYTVVYNKRAARLKITVDAERGAVVTAPPNCSRALLESWVRAKEAWIQERLDSLAAKTGCPVPRRFTEGEKFFFLGGRYVLRITGDHAGPGVRLAGKHIEVALDTRQRVKGPPAVKDTLQAWYREQAERVIMDRVRHHALATRLLPARVRVKTQRCRWGSCSATGNLNFNWKLVMAPLEIIDYVVVHEICHLVRLDHSPEFWRQVGDVLPDYRKRRRWLKENGPVLGF